MRTWIIAGGIVLAVILAVTAFLTLGAYNFAADAPHSALVQDLIEYARDRSIEVRSEGIQTPDLSDPGRITQGAVHYAEMCTGCHLAPGMDENEMRPGMNPKPPKLALMKGEEPEEQFWIVKHGIKMSGMPAWGATHSDEEIWAIVAFLQKLPELSPEQYRAMTAGAPQEHEHHEH